MTHQEFFERTKINMTGEEYDKVESLYNHATNLDKDDFCAEWKKLRNNPLIKALTIGVKRLEGESLNNETSLRSLKAEMKELARKVVRANEDVANYPRVYDVIEEEFGIDFIIKTKHEAGLPLSEEEIKYMVGKL